MLIMDRGRQNRYVQCYEGCLFFSFFPFLHFVSFKCFSKCPVEQSNHHQIPKHDWKLPGQHWTEQHWFQHLQSRHQHPEDHHCGQYQVGRNMLLCVAQARAPWVVTWIKSVVCFPSFSSQKCQASEPDGMFIWAEEGPLWDCEHVL